MPSPSVRYCYVLSFVLASLLLTPAMSMAQDFNAAMSPTATQPIAPASPVGHALYTPPFVLDDRIGVQCNHWEACREEGDRVGLRIANPAFRIGGWLQQGITGNVANPTNRSNAPVLFNDRANDYQLNQFYLYAAKEVHPDAFDIGGRIDVTFGTDSRFVTVPGLEEHDDRTQRWNGENDLYGVAIPQAYVEVASPLGPHGSTLRVGHFYALGGYETFAAPDNFFYSHSYMYLYGEPFTFSGAMWLGKLNETTSAGIAVTSGWDSLATDLDEWGLRIGLMKKFNGGATTVAITAHTGKDFTGIQTAAGQMDDPRHWASLVVKHHFAPHVYYVFQSDYGHQDNAVVVLDTMNNTVGFRNGQWWGVNNYLVWELSEQLSAGLRVEWFRDQGNSRVSVPIDFNPGGPTFNGEDYVALTAGLNWKPHTNVIIRPELRWDVSNVESNPNVPGGVAGIRPYNDRSDDNQLTLAVDAILLY